MLKELNNGKKPLCLAFYRLMGSSQWLGHMVKVNGQWKTGPIRGCLYGARPGENHSGNAHQKNPLPDSEGDWNGQADLLMHSLEGATWVYEVSRHVGGAAMQDGLNQDRVLFTF